MPDTLKKKRAAKRRSESLFIRVKPSDKKWFLKLCKKRRFKMNQSEMMAHIFKVLKENEYQL